MTHCLNCGAERDSEVCDSCGLNSSEAEFSLRKKLLNRTAFFVLGSLAFVAASNYYPPLELDGILIFIGVLFFLTLGLAIWLERRALRHLELEALKRVYYGLIPLPWIFSTLMLANGALDRAPPQVEEAHVVGKFSMGGALPSRRLVVTSWRDGHRIERVPVDRVNFDNFNRGDVVEVKVKDGLVGIPWVVDVFHR
ncbi:MAG TPA: hypothetical protein VN846_00515 [Candidatus Cybelea sp.]|jgi:hypothetical protein|nr:hypothetical protein [Candidatus Cybelea sp.]